MKAAVVVAKDRIEIQDVPVPALEAEAVLVKVEAVALCNATDLRILKAEDPTKVWPNQPWPFIMGHETCGRVVAVGAAVQGWRVGDRIAGWCPRQGGYAEYSLIYPGRIAAVKVPDWMASDTAALLEPALGAVRFFGRDEVRRRLQDARRAYIAGLGPAGLMYVMLARCLGYETVCASGNQAARRALAVELGATEVFDPADNPTAILAGRGFQADVAIDTTGADVADDVLRVLRPGGVLIPFGVGFDWRTRQADLDRRDIHRADGAHAEAAHFAPSVLSWIREGKLPVDRLITLRIPLEGIAEAFERVARRKEIKVVVMF